MKRFLKFTLVNSLISYRTQLPDQTTVDTHDNQEKSSSIIDTITSTIAKVQDTILGKQESTTEKTPASTDSLVNIVEQIKIMDQRSKEKQPQQLDHNEQETISPISSVPIDEVSSINLQSKQNITQETEDVEEQQIILNAQKSSQPLRSEDRLLSTESAVEDIPSVSISEEQKEPILRSSTTTTETIERTTSLERPSSTDEQTSSDSLADIIRQIGSIPQITRHPSTDDKTETSQIIEHEIETPSIDSSAEIVQTNESIPNEPVTTKQTEEEVVQTVDTKDLLPASNEISLVTETEQEPVKEDEPERLSSETVHEILATPIIAPPSSDYVTTETVELVEKPNEIIRYVSSFPSYLKIHFLLR
jgi:hypothetical protein